jgi:hypothetical protein
VEIGEKETSRPRFKLRTWGTREGAGGSKRKDQKSKVKNRTLKTAGMRHAKASEHVEGALPGYSQCIVDDAMAMARTLAM